MVDAWNCQKHYVTADPLIVSENRHIKSIAKIKSWLTHEIVKNNMSLVIHESS